jgi:hypothetical protein
MGALAMDDNLLARFGALCPDEDYTRFLAMLDSHDRPKTVQDEAPEKYQVGGDHYVRHAIQPWDIIDCYDLDFYEGNALKYLLRRKIGESRVQDLKKCQHYLERCLKNAQNEMDDGK